MLKTILSAPPIQSLEQCSTNSAYELAFIFINKNYTENDDIPKADILNSILEMLSKGCTYQEIINKIHTCHCKDGNYKSFFNTIRPTTVNLINQNRFYYHNELRVYPPAPTRKIDYNTGQIVSSKFEYFLEMKASYTINDLMEYIKTKSTTKNLFNNPKRLLGGLNSMLSKYDIELLLFLIDTSDIIYFNKNKFFKNIFEMDDFIEEAKVNYNMKVTEAVYNDSDKIVPRKRILFERRDK